MTERGYDISTKEFTIIQKRLSMINDINKLFSSSIETNPYKCSQYAKFLADSWYYIHKLFDVIDEMEELDD